MSAYTYVVADQLISRKPCKLFSLVLTNTGPNDGMVIIYDARTADAAHKVATVMVGRESSNQHRWEGLELTRGLYIDIDDKTDMVTIEWEPLEC